MFLRMSDLGVEPAQGDPDPLTGEPTVVDPPAVWDESTGAAVAFSETTTPQLEGVGEVNGIKVQTVYENAMGYIGQYPPAAASAVCGVSEDDIRELARVYHEDGPVTTEIMMGIDVYKRQALHRVEVPRVVGVEHAVVVQVRAGKPGRETLLCFRLPPAVRDAQRARRLRGVEVRHEFHLSVAGGHDAPLAFGDVLALGVCGVEEESRLGVAPAQAFDLVQVGVVGVAVAVSRERRVGVGPGAGRLCGGIARGHIVRQRVEAQRGNDRARQLHLARRRDELPHGDRRAHGGLAACRQLVEREAQRRQPPVVKLVLVFPGELLAKAHAVGEALYHEVPVLARAPSGLLGWSQFLGSG